MEVGVGAQRDLEPPHVRDVFSQRVVSRDLVVESQGSGAIELSFFSRLFSLLFIVYSFFVLLLLVFYSFLVKFVDYNDLEAPHVLDVLSQRVVSRNLSVQD